MSIRVFLFPVLLASTACGDDGAAPSEVDAGPPSGLLDGAPDGPPGCDPATVLPAGYRPIALVSAGAVVVSTTAGTTAGTVDATAGGPANAADQPYLYVDLRAGAKVEVTDLEARTSTAWDLAFKRSSLRINGGDSGPGSRQLAVVAAATLDEVTTAPAASYGTDDFATDDCMLVTLPGGEPRSALGEWYAYNPQLHTLSPNSEVYVLERSDRSRTAFRITTYYGDPGMPMRGALYGVEWKQLAAR